MRLKRALFIDRDGVICRMVKYQYGWDSPQRSEDVFLVEGIADLIKKAKEKGLLIVEISNQPGVAKGKMSQETSDTIEDEVHRLLNKEGIKIDYIYICPHHPEGMVAGLTYECDCRKPKPGLLLKAAKDLNINLQKSLFLGDSASDVEAGKAAGCKTIIYLHSNNEAEKVKAAFDSHADIKIKKMSDLYKEFGV